MKNFLSEMIEAGHWGTRVLMTLIVASGFSGAIWVAAEKYNAKADITYVDNKVELARATIKTNSEKSNYIIRKSIEAQTEQRTLLQEKIKSGRGNKYDFETIKYLNRDIERLQELLEK
jgi:hypothetical protein